MNIEKYIDEMKKKIHRSLLDFIDNEDNSEEYFQNLIRNINDQKICNDKE